MKQRISKMTIMDINLAAFLSLNGVEPEFTKQGTRVVFEFPGTDEVADIMRTYNTNILVPVLDFVHHLRKTRSMMLAAR